MEPKWSPNVAKMDKKWSQNGSKMEQKWKIRREQIIGSAMEHLRKIQETIKEKSKKNHGNTNGKAEEKPRKIH